MFATSLFPLPPPSTSLLPSLIQQPSEPPQHSQPHHLQSRRKTANRPSTLLTTLTQDERQIASRKLAIAMYGYSWLKPAGCTKTMLGRREEELEREEVERQLREVELQERMAMEQEEQERREELGRQAEGGEVEGVGERDLDDEVPEADEGQEGEASGEEAGDGEEDEEDLEGDLDDDIPDADADGHESSWVYDTRREPDTESEGDQSSNGSGTNGSPPHPRLPRGGQTLHSSRRNYAEQDDPVATEALVNAMLDEDELGEYEHQHDLDDDIPDVDMDQDLDADDNDLDMDVDMDANLSDEVPDADQSPRWEHTDSELEESEMDISLLPPHPNSTSRNPGTTHEEMRRVSGNRMLPPPLPPPSQPRSHPPEQQRQQQQWPRTAAPRRNLRAMMQTPTSEDEISALISTGGTSTQATGPAADSSVEPQSPQRRSWLNAAGARRNLFANLRSHTGSTTTTTNSGPSSSSTPQTQSQGQSAAGPARSLGTGVSSGGLFTPSPRQAAGSDDEHHGGGEQSQTQSRTRTRSGRLLSGLQVGRRTRRRDGET